MGLIQHHALIAVTWDDAEAKRMRDWVDGLTEKVSSGMEIKELFREIPSTTNGYTTFVMAPDGSKEGWATSNMADSVRTEFRLQIEKSGRWDWIEATFGECGQGISSGNCDEEW